METAEAVVFPNDAYAEELANKYRTAVAISEFLGKATAHVESLREHIVEVSY